MREEGVRIRAEETPAPAPALAHSDAAETLVQAAEDATWAEVWAHIVEGATPARTGAAVRSEAAECIVEVAILVPAQVDALVVRSAQEATPARNAEEATHNAGVVTPASNAEVGIPAQQVEERSVGVATLEPVQADAWEGEYILAEET